MTIADGADDILALNTMTTSMFSHYAGNIFKSESFVFPVTVSLDETAMKLNNATIPLTPGMTVAVEIRSWILCLPNRTRLEGQKHASRAL